MCWPLAWLNEHPQHWGDLAVLMADKLRVVGMAEGYGVQNGKGGTRRLLAVTQQELALMIGVSRQTTNQILKELEAQGILRVQRGGWRYWICRRCGRCVNEMRDQ